jgi:hypothetical protein
MKRFVIIALTLILLAAAAYVADQYWIHRYDSLIATEAARYRVDPDLVWSIAYEESYFAPWKNGRAGEIGMMQVTPGVSTRLGFRECRRGDSTTKYDGCEHHAARSTAQYSDCLLVPAEGRG